MVELSICIPTLNRADFIGETLDSVVLQLQPGVEVVIVDGGSKDATESVVRGYAERFPCIRYIRREGGSVPSNAGFDRDCSYAVESAEGQHCWLMTDDDVLMPGAISSVLDKVREGHDLVIVSCEVRNIDFQKVLVDNRPGLRDDQVYTSDRWDEFFKAVVIHLTFLGAVVIRRSEWLKRDAQRFFGSGFVHVGVVFSAPVPKSAVVIAKPLILIRNGNAQWNARAFDIFMVQWPALIWSFPGISDEAKQAITPREPWRLLRVLLLQRAFGRYTPSDFERIKVKLSLATRGIARLISKAPIRLLYWPARLYGRLKHEDPRYFNSTLEEARAFESRTKGGVAS